MALPGAGDWVVLDAWLDQALALPPADRARWLRDNFADDPQRCAQLRDLLAVASQDDPLSGLAASPLVLEALADLPGIGPGDSLGEWRLRERIGTGGMAEVFLAERVRGGVRQRAALKLLAIAGAGHVLRQRFARECRILATLSDARIARYYDSGIAADGRPWLAMEHIDGQPLDRYLQARNLPLRARLALFLELAGAVAHAHRHLIVHRDLKPGNVLVTNQGQLKLIDFGISRSLAEDAPAQATALEARLLTLDYASPEQLRGETVTTASDGYQLGLILYRLVARRHPFAGASGDRLAMTRLVLERDPDPPSRILRRDGDRGAAASAAGDLDAIVLKALAKEPGLRYDSVDALATDLRAWLEDRPVRARGATPWQRLGKFARRHRTGLVLSALAAVVLAALVGAWLQQALRASREAETAQAVLDLFERTLHANRYGVQPQPPETVADLLDVAERRAGESLAGQPAALARTLLLIGQTRIGRGEYLAAAEVLRQARASAEQVPGGFALDHHIIEALVDSLHFSGDYRQAMHWVDVGLAAAGDQETQGKLFLLLARADLVHSLGDYPDAQASAEEALVLALQLFGADDARTARAHQVLGMVLRDRFRLDEARRHLRRAIAIERAELPPMHVNLAASLDHLAVLELQQGDLDAAAERAHEVARIRSHLFQPGFLGRTWGDHRLALLQLLQGDAGAAAEGLSVVLDSYQRELGPTSHITALAQSDLGWALLADGQLPTAAAQFRQAERMLAGFGQGRHPRRSEALLGLAVVALASGDEERTGELAQQAADLRRHGSADDHPALAAACRVLRRVGRDCQAGTPGSAQAQAWRQLELALSALAIDA